ncbi:biotin--[acetyl-CoA-carboxylase] ligase [Glycomyces tenuis]|uniref:biotin--[acetyl-CoA-carboxylase] ligase n=1 Tax=Glycomyces tenuis TaxID=58116 RepID=UPI00054EC167|nr:biotin--[acetyl-CoA-carboxylase] ligase [Glycomyces tenuis]
MSTPMRTPLDRARLRSLLSEKSDFWTEVDVVEVTGSTNADLVGVARRGGGEGRVLIAEQQTAGRGRLDRRWTCPVGAGLMMSVLLRPGRPRREWGTLSLAAAVALEETLRAVAGVAARLKWPNDVLIGGRKVCGILATGGAEDGSVVLGLGLNVSLTESELPVPEATSLLLAGAATLEREVIAAEFLAHFAAVYRTWGESGPAHVVERWREYSATLGRNVEVSFPNGRKVAGVATDIAADGRLVVAGRDGEGREEVVTVAAGDVVHLRRGD